MCEDKEGNESESRECEFDEPCKMSLVDHLKELRYRIIFSLVAFVLGSVGGWFTSLRIISYFKSISYIKNIRLIMIRPSEAFFARLKVAMAVGLLVSLPIILHQALAFVLPALTKKEKIWVFRLLVPSVFLFYGGVFFSLYVMLPIVLKFFLVELPRGVAEPQVSIGEYISFLTSIGLMGGLVFQTPIVLFFLTIIGVLSSEKLRKGRKYAILIIFIIAAFASPPDPFSQVVLAIPMIILYELSIFLTALSGR